MPEEEMARMCAVTTTEDDEPIYPDVDDLGELKVGAVVFVTVNLTKTADPNDTMDYALPGIIYSEEVGKLAVRPCPTKLWTQGWEEVKMVAVVRSTRLRFCSTVDELDDDQLIMHFYEDDIGVAAELCGDRLLKDNQNFKKWMGGFRTANKFKTQRWKFLLLVAENMGSTLSISEWRKKRPSNLDEKDAGKDPLVAWIDTEFITPALAEETSAMETEEDKKKYKTEVSPKIQTTVNYLTMVMDIMTSDDGPSSKKMGATTTVVDESGLKELTSQVAELKATVASLSQTVIGSLNAIATQLNIRDDSKNDDSVVIVDNSKAVPLAVIVGVSGDHHECAYHVMSAAKAINDGVTQPGEAPTFNDTAVDAARLALVMQAKRAHETDPKGFEARLGFTVDQMYQQVSEAKQDEKTWPGELHFHLHAEEHPDVELKLKTFRGGKLATISTRQEHLPPAKLVMFANWRPGHFDIMGVKQDGVTKIAFTQEEVVAADLLMDALLEDKAPAMSKLSNEEFKSAFQAVLTANRELDQANKGSVPVVGGDKPKKKPTTSPAPSPTVVLVDESGDDDDQRAVASSMATFVQEETVRNLQAQMQAQSKQMQAQAQLALQARHQVVALEAQLRASKAGDQQQGGTAAASSAKPRQQPAPATAAVHQQGTSALDMILNGSAAGRPAVQPALVIWSGRKKQLIEQALHKLDAVAFKAVHSMTKTDAGTPDARFIVSAFPQDVAVVQQLLVPLVAAGMRAEFHDPTIPSNASSWSTVGTSANTKTTKKSKLAGQAQAGLSTVIAKAGQTGTPNSTKRVHGQCDYYSARLTCPRGSACGFTCYNGPGSGRKT